MTFICLNIELRTQPLKILVVIAGTDKERPGCSKIRLNYNIIDKIICIFLHCVQSHMKKLWFLIG
jgi:hypothetical protein